MQNELHTGIHDGRVDWVDYAKGFCIVFVVMMHSTLGVEAVTGKEGWLHHVVEFARPFRMPDFFLISGLFLAKVIDRDWRTYIDRKVVHFFYFYLLWTAIQFAFKAPGFIAEQGVMGVAHAYLMSFVEPFGTLWFIYLLPIFFIVVKLTKRVPWPVIWLIGAAMEISQVQTGWMVPDEFASRFVYFYTGYIAARYIFAIAARAQSAPALAMTGLVIWGIGNGLLVKAGVAALPFYSLTLGLIGAVAVVTVSALLAQHDVFKPLRYCGRNSIVIYLAFFLPMAASRTVLTKTGIVTDIGTISALVTATGVIGALAIFWAVRFTPLKFLFERPAMFWLVPDKKKHEPRLAMQPAE